MKRVSVKYLILLVLGASLLSFNLLTRNNMALSIDFGDFLKGMGAGIMIMTLIFTAKSQISQ